MSLRVRPCWRRKARRRWARLRSGNEDEAEEGAGVVGGEFLGELLAQPIGGVVEEEGRIGVEDFIDEVEGVSLAVGGLSGLVRWQEELGETVGDAGGKVPPSYALRATDGRWLVTRGS